MAVVLLTQFVLKSICMKAWFCAVSVGLTVQKSQTLDAVPPSIAHLLFDPMQVN